MKKKIVSALLCATLLSGLLTGCGNGGAEQQGSGETGSSDQSAEKTSEVSEDSQSSATEETPAVPEDFDPRTAGLSDIFPLEEPITLTYLIRQNDAMAATMDTYADVEFLKRLEELDRKSVV